MGHVTHATEEGEGHEIVLAQTPLMFALNHFPTNSTISKEFMKRVCTPEMLCVRDKVIEAPQRVKDMEAFGFDLPLHEAILGRREFSHVKLMVEQYPQALIADGWSRFPTYGHTPLALALDHSPDAEEDDVVPYLLDAMIEKYPQSVISSIVDEKVYQKVRGRVSLEVYQRVRVSDGANHYLLSAMIVGHRKAIERLLDHDPKWLWKLEKKRELEHSTSPKPYPLSQFISAPRRRYSEPYFTDAFTETTFNLILDHWSSIEVLFNLNLVVIPQNRYGPMWNNTATPYEPIVQFNLNLATALLHIAVSDDANNNNSAIMPSSVREEVRSLVPCDEVGRQKLNLSSTVTRDILPRFLRNERIESWIKNRSHGRQKLLSGLIKMNSAGRAAYLMKNPHDKDAGVKVLSSVSSDPRFAAARVIYDDDDDDYDDNNGNLDAIYYHLRENPALCDIQSSSSSSHDDSSAGSSSAASSTGIRSRKKLESKDGEEEEEHCRKRIRSS